MRQQHPPPLPYQTPPHGHPGGVGSVFDVNTFARATLVVGTWAVVMLLVVPQFETTFRDFKTDLPPSTKFLLATGRALAEGWWLALLTIPPGLAFLVAQFGPVGRRLARSAIMLGFGALILFVALGVFQPMLTLIDGISSRK